LREEGYDIVFRSAGSHSPIDVIGIKYTNARTIKFIQSKPKKFSKNQKQKLLDSYAGLNDEFICSFEVV